MGKAATVSLPISKYLTTPFILGGASKIPYWYYIAGGVAAGGTLALFDDSDSDDDGPIVTSFTPEGTTYPAGTGTISFDFSKDMTPATVSNFVITSAGSVWSITSVVWANSRSVQAIVAGPTAGSPPFTITLVGFTDTVGIPLVGKTSFNYN